MNSEPGGAEGVRLQKALAAAGIGSRRASEQLVSEGRVTVNGRVAELGARIDPGRDEVRVDGQRVNLRAEVRYLAFNKPLGVVSAMSDPQGRPTITDYLGDVEERLFHVGRLDVDTEGLLILTNDGDFAQRLAHPSHGVVKVYVAEVPGPVEDRTVRTVRSGVMLEDGPVAVNSFRVIGASGTRSLVEVAIHEGRKHIVRRLLAEVGHPVQRLVRISVGAVRLGDLSPGRMRELTRAELGALYDEIER